jgi:hypothetical protein
MKEINQTAFTPNAPNQSSFHAAVHRLRNKCQYQSHFFHGETNRKIEAGVP